MRLSELTHTFLFSAALLAPSGLFGQVQQQVDMPTRGIYPHGTYTRSAVDSIDVSGGGVNLTIPLGSLPPGPSGTTFDLSLQYNSQLWDTNPQASGEIALLPSPYAGWRYNFEYQLVLDYRERVDGSCANDPGYQDKRWRLRMVFPDGSARVLHPNLTSTASPTSFFTDACGDGYYQIDPDFILAGCPQCQLSLPGSVSTVSYYTTDGSGIRLEWSPIRNLSTQQIIPWTERVWTLFLPDGNRVAGVGRYNIAFFDPSQNTINLVKSLQVGSRPRTTITDAAARTVHLDYYRFAGIGFDFPKDEVVGSGFLGTTITTVVNWANVPIDPKTYNCRANPPQCQIAAVFGSVASIVYPPATGQSASRTHSFEYYAGAGWGQLKKQTLPSGYSAEYVYSFLDPYSSFGPPVSLQPIAWKTVRYSEENPGPPTAGAQAQRSETWSWSFAGTQTSEVAPDGGVTTTDFIPSAIAFGFGGNPRLVWRTQFPNGDRVDRIWKANRPYPRFNAAASGVDNPFVWAEYRSLSNGSTLVKSTARCMDVDKNNNIIELKESDFFNYPSGGFSTVQFPLTGACPQVAVPFLRQTMTTYTRPTPASGTVNENANAYWNFSPNTNPTRRTLTAVATQTVTGSGGNGRQMQYEYLQDGQDEAGGRATPNIIRRCNAQGQSCTSTSVFYTSWGWFWGGILETVNEIGTKTRFAYTPIGVPGAPTLYPDSRTDGFGSAAVRTFNYTHDMWTGLLKTVNDVQNGMWTTLGYDNFGRLTSSVETGGVSGQAGYLERKTRTTRDDILRYEAVTMPSVVAATGPVAAINRYEMGGAVRLGQSIPDIGTVSTADSASGIRTDRRRYVVSGSAIYEVTSTPIGSWTDTTSGWVRTKMDRVGRPVEITDFDGPDLPFPFNNGGGRTTGSSGSVITSYSANEETVTDKAGKVLKSVRDGLGRVTSVIQDGNTTTYGYDALGNLSRVDQSSGGFSQARIFVYDHHSRLLQAWQPETSPMSPADPSNPGVPTNRPTTYTYYADGSLWTRTDGRGVVTTNTYDVHGRLKTTSYSDGTPSVTLNYDAGGRLSSADAANVSTTTFFYDSLGRFFFSQD
ncbi:MAG: hypothetical protein NTV52_00530 [Acidobacteria bacterium]|nr:hypothetical protein [Acidobacteriota bacterium]